MSTLTIRIPDDLRRQLDDIGVRQRRSAEDVVCQMIQRQLAVDAFRSARQRTLSELGPDAPASDEEVFRAVSAR